MDPLLIDAHYHHHYYYQHCDVADAADTADDVEYTADSAEDGRDRVGRDTAALDRTEFPVRTEVLGDIREDGKIQVLFGWMGQ